VKSKLISHSDPTGARYPELEDLFAEIEQLYAHTTAPQARADFLPIIILPFAGSLFPRALHFKAFIADFSKRYAAHDDLFEMKAHLAHILSAYQKADQLMNEMNARLYEKGFQEQFGYIELLAGLGGPIQNRTEPGNAVMTLGLYIDHADYFDRMSISEIAHEAGHVLLKYLDRTSITHTFENDEEILADWCAAQLCSRSEMQVRLANFEHMTTGRSSYGIDVVVSALSGGLDLKANGDRFTPLQNSIQLFKGLRWG
jgi:hypothetical protein